MRIATGIPLLALPAWVSSWPTAAAAQTLRLTRAEAVAAALARSPRLALAAADTAVAFAQLRAARLIPDPALAASYSKSTPNYHLVLDQPLDLPWLRGPRVASAREGRVAAQLRFTFERAAVSLEADTLYTRALAARERARLSGRNAVAADSLRRLAERRREAGDASDLDVALATIAASQAENVAAADSLAYLGTLLDLQAVMGLAADRVAVWLADSLQAPENLELMADTTVPAAGTPLQIAAAEAALESARLGLRFQRRSVWGVLSVSGGIETGDPTGSEPGLLPTVGVGVSLPLWNRNRGGAAQAAAELARARAQLALAETEWRTELARARRELAVAARKVARARDLAATAERVAAMSLTAYREGASPLPSVLEAQRNAREVLAQYVEDVAAALIAAARLRVLTRTTESPVP